VVVWSDHRIIGAVHLVSGPVIVRDWQREDAAAIVHHANNRKIWINVRDRFPSPYTLEDADNWVRHCARTLPATDFAIEVAGQAVGGIGVVLHDDVERVSAELGFWLGESLWGRGVMTAAVQTFVPWAFERFALTRIYANVFDFNLASARVLEKAGFAREALQRRAVIKDERVIDQFVYARIREDGP
jgi:[ribosomal protein S5]-alanine N-acetyltransferase